MCGIFGMASKGGARNFNPENATNTLAHRGPDDCGYFRDEHVGLGHRRLSIIDVAGGQQPIYNEDRSKCIIFNGEIYNYRSLYQQLKAKGHRFNTLSDTETILHGYEEWGEACVEKLRGMFAFAIWDSHSQSLFMARDRLGIKPLFYAHHNHQFYFASEMKAILSEPSFPRRLNKRALSCYFTLSYIPDALTIYEDIYKLLPGHTLTWKAGNIRIRKYWDLFVHPDYGKSEEYFVDGLLERLHEAVEMRLMSEVPLGGFLSGGIDSSMVVANMSRSSRTPVNTFCIGFGGKTGGYLDERPFARMVADRYATRHRSYEVIPKADGLVETIVRAFDEPFADDSAIPSYFVCKIARENVTVALSGLGGDEAFAGYERYLGFMLHSGYARLPSSWRRSLIPKMIGKIPERSDGHYTINHLKRFVRSGALPPDEAYFGFLSIMPPGLSRLLFSEPQAHEQYYSDCRELILKHYHSANVAENSHPLNRVLYCDIKTYLPEDILAVTDRMSMQHSLEVRVPFIDHLFLEFAATIPAEMKMSWWRKKYLLKKAAAQLLPQPVIRHRKQGFVGPMAQWLKGDLKPYVLEALRKDKIASQGVLNPTTVQRILSEHFDGKEIHDTLIWSILIFQKWHDIYISGNPQIGEENIRETAISIRNPH